MHDEGIFKLMAILEEAEKHCVKTVKPTRARATTSAIFAAMLKRQQILVLVPTNDLARDLELFIAERYNEYCSDWKEFTPLRQHRVLRIRSNEEACPLYPEWKANQAENSGFVFYRSCPRCKRRNDCEFVDEIMNAVPDIVICTYDKAASIYVTNIESENNVTAKMWEQINRPRIKMFDEYDDIIPSRGEVYRVFTSYKRFVGTRIFNRDINNARLNTAQYIEMNEAALDGVTDPTDATKLRSKIEAKQRVLDALAQIEQFLHSIEDSICPQILEPNFQINVLEIEKWLQSCAKHSNPRSFARMSQFIHRYCNTSMLYYYEDNRGSRVFTQFTHPIHFMLSHFSNDAHNQIVFMSASGEEMDIKKILKIERDVVTEAIPDYRETERQQLIIADTAHLSVEMATTYSRSFLRTFRRWVTGYRKHLNGIPMDYRSKNIQLMKLTRKSLPRGSIPSYFYSSTTRGVQSDCDVMVTLGLPYTPRFSSSTDTIKYTMMFENAGLRRRMAEIFNTFVKDSYVMGFSFREIVAYLQGYHENESIRQFMIEEKLKGYQRATLIREIFEYERKVREEATARSVKQTIGRVKHALGERRSVVLAYGSTYEEWQKMLGFWATPTPPLVAPISNREKETQFIMARLWLLGYPYAKLKHLPTIARAIEFAQKYGTATPPQIARCTTLMAHNVSKALGKYGHWAEHFGFGVEQYANGYRLRKL